MDVHTLTSCPLQLFSVILFEMLLISPLFACDVPVLVQDDGRYVGRVIDLFSGFGTHDTLQLQLRPTKAGLDESRAR